MQVAQKFPSVFCKYEIFSIDVIVFWRFLASSELRRGQIFQFNSPWPAKKREISAQKVKHVLEKLLVLVPYRFIYKILNSSDIRYDTQNYRKQFKDNSKFEVLLAT